MSPNPNSGDAGVRHPNPSGSENRPLPSRKWREDQDDDYPAARVPTAPRLTTEFDAKSIVNRDYADDELALDRQRDARAASTSTRRR